MGGGGLSQNVERRYSNYQVTTCVLKSLRPDDGNILPGDGLPQYVVLRHTASNKYVTCAADGSLGSDGNDILSPHCKFELERAQSGEENCFSIRSCYNNKYWQVGKENPFSVNATAAKPIEDRLDFKCTLLCKEHPIYDPSCYLYFVSESAEIRRKIGSHLTHNQGFLTDSTYFVMTDWESLVIFPKHVTFKTDYGEYLAAQWIERHQYHKFNSKDPRDPRNAYEIFPNGNGSVRIKSNYFNKFWRRSPNWIWADSSDDTTYYNDDTVFVPVKFGNDNSSIALRNLGNNKFCFRLSTEGKYDCLNAGEDSITREAKFIMEEAVLSRVVTNVRYRLNHARIYDENILTMVNREAVNYSSVPETVTMKLAYTQGSSKTWERGVSSSLSVSTTFKTGIPIIAGGEVKVSGSVGGYLKWGDTEESSKLVETTQTVTVPPRTHVKTSLLATEATCDVPFSYTQRDVLPDGRVVTYDMDDGLFTGINTYNFRFETTEQKL